MDPRLTRTVGSETLDLAQSQRHGPRAPSPGWLWIWDARGPKCVPTSVGAGDTSVTVARQAEVGTPCVVLPDPTVSRRHATMQRRGATAGWEVVDLGSRNGTWADGVQVVSNTSVRPVSRVLRVGGCLLVPVDDVHRYERGLRMDDTEIVGAILDETRDAIARAARHGECLLLQGESGSGKEHAARAFHAASPNASGPFVAVNCAAIPEGLAERLLFGAKKGAYSGATSDADGWVQAADGGTLFLDEIGELELSIQAKLLRVLESREVMPVGASKGRPVRFHLVAATHRDLRAAVGDGKFRGDLFFRIGRPTVLLPPLRERVDELPYLIQRAVAAVDASLEVTPSLVEACVLREWPGNVRELLAEVTSAAVAAVSAGRRAVSASDLAAHAGLAITGRGAEHERHAADAAPKMLPDDATVAETLAAHGGNVSATARALGVHRTQLRRWMERHAPRQAVDSSDEG